MDNPTPAMTPNEPLMDQCRKEAEERYPPDIQHWEHGNQMIRSAMQTERAAAYYDALYHERTKPRTSLSVEDVMRILDEWKVERKILVSTYSPFDEVADLRARLTAKLNELNTQTNG